MYERPTPLQKLIEKNVTNGRGFTSGSSYHKNRDNTDELDLQHYLGTLELDKLNSLLLPDANSIFSDLHIIEALGHNRKGKVYTSVAEVNEAICEHRNKIRNTSHLLEENRLFADCKDDPDFREWCAAGRDPWNYPGSR